MLPDAPESAARVSPDRPICLCSSQLDLAYHRGLLGVESPYSCTFHEHKNNWVRGLTIAFGIRNGLPIGSRGECEEALP